MRISSVIIILLLLVGCAAPKLYITDQTGRSVPSPSYVLYSSSSHPLQVTFYWSSTKIKKDLDNSTHKIPTFFNFTKPQTFDVGEVDSLLLIMEVHNPKELKYQLWEVYTASDRKGNKLLRDQMIAESNFRYRRHVVNLPYNVNLKRVSYGVQVIDNSGIPVMNIGDVVYRIVDMKKGGDMIQTK
jgi:hypothetical protein